MPNYSPKILVTGGHGQLASALANHPLAKEFTLMICSHEELDITQPAAINRAIAQFLPDIIVNTAAYTAVDKAEEEASSADRINHIGAGQLALACEKNQIKLLHISSDYVFDGNKDGKYLEDDKPNPINIYGKSKWDGERAIQNGCNNHIILRVTSVFSEYGSNFLKTILKLARERSTLRVVSDQIMCPTYAGDIASAIYIMCNQPAFKGTLHFSSAESVSWYDFAQAIVDEARLHETLAADEILQVPSSEYPTAAKRPRFSVLDCHKLKEVYRIDQPSWRDAVINIVPKLIQEKA